MSASSARAAWEESSPYLSLASARDFWAASTPFMALEDFLMALETSRSARCTESMRGLMASALMEEPMPLASDLPSDAPLLSRLTPLSWDSMLFWAPLRDGMSVTYAVASSTPSAMRYLLPSGMPSCLAISSMSSAV